MYITNDLFAQHDNPATSQSRPSKLTRAKTFPDPSSETLGKRRWSSVPVEEPVPKRPSISIHQTKAVTPPPRRLLEPRSRRRTAFAENKTRTIRSVLPPKPSKTHAILQPCHICHRAPKQKGDLDAYTDCNRCHERTCYICMRQCEANCCDPKVCSRCCVERGQEGAVQCLNCLWQDQKDHDMED